MKGPQSNLDFILMTYAYRVRDFLFPRREVLQEVGIQEGFRVLDYGCGSGSYIVPLVELVGSSGEIYSLDVNPLAIEMVRSTAAKRGLINVKTIRSDCRTGLPKDCVDVVLLYDILHHLEHPDDMLRELRRILKREGILSASDHHMKEEKILEKVTRGNLFMFARKGRKTYSFHKV